MTFLLLRRLALACALALAAPAAAFAQSEGNLAAMVAAWAASGHADAKAEAFVHWNEEGEVPAQCATCHAGAGFRDFYGLDGTAAGTVDRKTEIGGVIDCDTCHAEGVDAITEVAFPSGVTLLALPDAGTCMTCHQGRASGLTVAGRSEGTEVDAVNPELSFLNPHYAAAAATNFGTEAKGLYEYPGQSYVGRFSHVRAAATCTGCHEPHTLEVRQPVCATCHEAAELADIRTSTGDYDGDGDITEGIAREIDTLKGMLAEAIAVYAADVAGTPIVYAEARYPYYFADLNGNGSADPEEASRDNAYKSWTPRLLAAAYNFQFVSKDPGSYAHNGWYVLQALHDSIADLASASDYEMPAIARP